MLIPEIPHVDPNDSVRNATVQFQANLTRLYDAMNGRTPDVHTELGELGHETVLVACSGGSLRFGHNPGAALGPIPDTRNLPMIFERIDDFEWNQRLCKISGRLVVAQTLRQSWGGEVSSLGVMDVEYTQNDQFIITRRRINAAWDNNSLLENMDRYEGSRIFDGQAWGYEGGRFMHKNAIVQGGQGAESIANLSQFLLDSIVRL